jgi:hypothetical protein
MNLFISLNYYRFQKRHKRFSCFADELSDEHLMPLPKDHKDKDQGHGLSVKAHSKEAKAPSHLVEFLTPEFAKFSEFSASDRRYDSRRTHFFKSYDHANIDFVHK